MIFKIDKDIDFSRFYKKMNILSFILICLSISVLLIKGLNFGVDFKGGTLIEIRTENAKIDISEIPIFISFQGNGLPVINIQLVSMINYQKS